MKSGSHEADIGRAALRFPVSYGIFRLARTHRAYAGELLRNLDLYTGQELIIMSLGENGPQQQGRLVELERLDHSTIAKSLRRMEHAGLVSRRPSKDDRRSVIVSLTVKGKAVHKKAEMVWRELERASVATLDPEQRDSLLRLMKTVEAGIASLE